MPSWALLAALEEAKVCLDQGMNIDEAMGTAMEKIENWVETPEEFEWAMTIIKQYMGDYGESDT